MTIWPNLPSTTSPAHHGYTPPNQQSQWPSQPTVYTPHPQRRDRNLSRDWTSPWRAIRVLRLDSRSSWFYHCHWYWCSCLCSRHCGRGLGTWLYRGWLLQGGFRWLGWTVGRGSGDSAGGRFRRRICWELGRWRCGVCLLLSFAVSPSTPPLWYRI